MLGNGKRRKMYIRSPKARAVKIVWKFVRSAKKEQEIVKKMIVWCGKKEFRGRGRTARWTDGSIFFRSSLMAFLYQALSETGNENNVKRVDERRYFVRVKGK